MKPTHCRGASVLFESFPQKQRKKTTCDTMLYESIDKNSYIVVFFVVFNLAKGQHKEQI